MLLSIGIGTSFGLNEVFTYIVAFNCLRRIRVRTHTHAGVQRCDRRMQMPTKSSGESRIVRTASRLRYGNYANVLVSSPTKCCPFISAAIAMPVPNGLIPKLGLFTMRAPPYWPADINFSINYINLKGVANKM